MFAQLHPDVAKLDMALVRGCDSDPTRRRLIRSITEACADVGVQVVCEGIETEAERDAIVDCGCDLLQGYLFAKPARGLILSTGGLRLAV
jgi:EAL domain-containing protein (putative c-di-GMP-specific phosphodiesterase class I)